MSEQQYFDSDALGRSDLRGIYMSPETWYGQRIGTVARPKPSPSMVFGSALDFYLCNGKGPDPIPDGVMVIPFDSRRSKAAKEMIAANPDVECITETEAEKLAGESYQQTMALMKCEQQIRDCPKAAALLYGAGCVHQQDYYWIDPDTGIELKSLPDVIKEGAAIVDLKTSADTTEYEFLRKVDRYWYDCQAHMMQAAHEAVTGDVLPVVFVVVRNTEPYDVELVAAPPWMLDTGRAKMRAAIARYQECESSGVWRSKTHNRIITPEQPRWWPSVEFTQEMEGVI